MKALKLTTTALCITLLSGCAAVQTAVEHRNLQASTKMSNTIFLDPTPAVNKIIYVQVKNTSDQQGLQIKQELVSDLQNKGWKITNDVGQAKRMVQVNILQAGKVKSEQSLMDSLSNGYGGALAGGLVGAAVGDSGGAALAGGVIGGTAAWLGGMLVKDVTYGITTDVQISVKLKKGQKVQQETNSNLQQGTSTNTHQDYQVTTNWIRYRTRLISYADKVNLDFKQAEPVLSKQLSAEIANIF